MMEHEKHVEMMLTISHRTLRREKAFAKLTRRAHRFKLLDFPRSSKLRTLQPPLEREHFRIFVPRRLQIHLVRRIAKPLSSQNTKSSAPSPSNRIST